VLALGTRHERVARFESAFREDNRLTIFYETRRTKDDSLAAPSISPDQPRWSTLDLPTISWSHIRPGGAIPASKAVTLDIQFGARPRPRARAETVTISPLEERGDFGTKLAACSRPGTLSLYDTSMQSLFLATRPVDATAPVAFVPVQFRSRDYSAPWAIAARVGLLPFALDADAVGAPPMALAWGVTAGLAQLGLIDLH
jgi:hypothetical protein